MPPKQRELTRNQVSSRLAYNASTPAFLQRMQAQVSRQTGRRFGNDEDEDDDDEAPQVEFESLDADRPAIPVRPRSPKPQKGKGRRGSRSGSEEDEEPEDERPQVIVLKEGKHLTKEEAENERRIAQGLPPLPISKAPADDADEPQTHSHTSESQAISKRKPASNSMAFATSSRKDDKRTAAKRRAAALGSDDESVGGIPTTKKVKAKAKKPEKKLLSFDDDG